MNQAGSHRGPDDVGYAGFQADNRVREDGQAGEQGRADGAWQVGLGHRRLAILDLSPGGHQPMSYVEGRYWLVFNGEIYNFIELQQELRGLGYAFHTRCDTEVILAAYAAWGKECLTRFNGMWAFALYDRQRRVLFCARDRFGVKPFHYRIRPGEFAFSSELKQMRALDQSVWRANRSIMGDFFLWRLYNHTADSAVEGIHHLPPSHYLEIAFDDVARGVVLTRQYWQPQAAPEQTVADAVGSFRELLTDAVRLRLRSDVPVGVTLSGGLDSSAVTCLAAGLQRAASGARLQSFTSDFDDAGFSELKYAQQAARSAGSDHVVIRPHSVDMSRDWSSFTRAIEEPFSCLSYFSNWLLYRNIRSRGIKVVLSGQGGDELLLGYPRYRVPLLLQQVRRGRLWDAARSLRHSLGHGGFSLASLPLRLAYFGSTTVRRGRLIRLLRPYLAPEFLQSARGHGEHLERTTCHRDRQELQKKEFFAYQLPSLLAHEDRVSMCFGVETRLPFLDYRLLDFILGQSDATVIHEGWSKWVLREAMRGVLPDEIRLRKDKMGFDTPVRLIYDNRAFFEGLMKQHLDDPLINMAAVLKGYEREAIDETLLCMVCSYLSWREHFNIRS
jgi:asparagine synthase (glutamine-hydrolysing)